MDHYQNKDTSLSGHVLQTGVSQGERQRQTDRERVDALCVRGRTPMTLVTIFITLLNLLCSEWGTGVNY